MSHATRNKSLAFAIKFVLLALLVVGIIYLLGRGNFLVRGIVVLCILTGAFLKVLRRWHSKSYSDSEVGYWSGLDDFDIGIFDCFEDEDWDESFDDDSQKAHLIP